MQEFYRIINDAEQRNYLRLNPAWYKYFNRTPDAYRGFRDVFENAKKEGTPSRLVTIDKHLNTANLMLKLLKGFK